MENIKKANKAKFDTILKGLERRGMKGFYAEDKEEALKIALSFIKEGDKVSCGGSMTLAELDLQSHFEEAGVEWINPNQYEDMDKKYEERVRALGSDVYYMSSNAITMDGILVNIDATGNRVAALCYGPKQVVLIVGANKIAVDEDDAINRIKTYACPPNCIRLGRNTPCAITGKCGECLSKETICSMTVSTRTCITDRINVILVNDNLGY